MEFPSLGLAWAVLGPREALAPDQALGSPQVGKMEPDTDVPSPTYWVAEGTMGRTWKNA